MTHHLYARLIKKLLNKETALLTDLAMKQPLYGDIPIWFEFDSGHRINLNGYVIIEDTTGLYQFLRCHGEQIIAKKKTMNSRFILVPRLDTDIVFYEKDYRNWRI